MEFFARVQQSSEKQSKIQTELHQSSAQKHAQIAEECQYHQEAMRESKQDFEEQGFILCKGVGENCSILNREQEDLKAQLQQIQQALVHAFESHSVKLQQTALYASCKEQNTRLLEALSQQSQLQKSLADFEVGQGGIKQNKARDANLQFEAVVATKVLNCLKQLTLCEFSQQEQTNGSTVLQCSVIKEEQMAMYRLSIRMDKPDRLTYESVRRQDRGKSYEIDVQFKSIKPGYQTRLGTSTWQADDFAGIYVYSFQRAFSRA